MFTIKREILISTEKHKCLLNTLQEDVIQLTATFKEIAHLGTIDTFFNNFQVISMACIYNLQNHTEVTLNNFENK